MKDSFVQDYADISSDRTFGFFFGVLFLIIAIYLFLIKDSHALAVFFLFFSVVFLSLAIMSPDKLSFFNRSWHKVGIFIGRFTSPIFLGILFFLLLSPVALFCKMIGRDALVLKKKTKSSSYWKKSSSRSQKLESFLDQF